MAQMESRANSHATMEERTQPYQGVCRSDSVPEVVLVAGTVLVLAECELVELGPGPGPGHRHRLVLVAGIGPEPRSRRAPVGPLSWQVEEEGRRAIHQLSGHREMGGWILLQTVKRGWTLHHHDQESEVSVRSAPSVLNGWSVLSLDQRLQGKGGQSTMLACQVEDRMGNWVSSRVVSS